MSLMNEVEGLKRRVDGAALLARLQEAALADEEGSALALELAGLGSAAARVAHSAEATEQA